MRRYLVAVAAAVALTVPAGTAWAYWSVGSVAGGGGAAGASTVNQGSTPTANATGADVTVSWAATTLANGMPVSGYVVKRYDASTGAAQTVLSACAGTIAATSCVESNVPNGSWKYAVTPVFATSWQGAESAKSATVVVNNDTTAPTNSLSLSSVTGGAILSGSTLYYRGSSAGSFRITNAVADSGSGPAGSSTAALGGTSTGWTHTPSTVSSPSGGPYVSNSFDWTAGTTSGPSETVTGRDGAGNTAATALSFVNDSTGPAGGSVDATGLVGTGSRYAPSTTLSLLLATGADANGVAASGNQLLRATAPLSNGTCGGYGSYAVVATDPGSPAADTVSDGACYRYRYVVSDALGNPTSYISPDVKVDVATPAAPALTFASLNNVYWGGTGSTVYYRSAATSGSVQLTATATAPSGVTGYAFPALGTGWTATPGATGVMTYSWSAAGPAAPGGTSVTATTNAGATSVAAPFTLTSDDIAPSGATVSYFDGTTTSATVTISLTNGTDAGSGIGTTRLQRAVATVQTNGSCGVFGAFTTLPNGTNPTSPVVDPVTANACYKYQYVVADQVGNTATVVGSGVVKVVTYAGAVSSEPSLVNWWRLGESSGTSAVDSKGTSNGVYLNGPALGVPGAIAGDSAAQFDGVNDYVTATSDVPSSFSVEFWFRSALGIGTSTSWTGGAGLVSADRTGTATDFGVSLRSDGKVVAGIGNSSIVSSTGGWNDNGWHHVVFTRSQQAGGGMVLYVDGVQVAGAGGPTGNVGGSATVALGRIQSAANNYLQGALDEVAIYGSVLDQATVSSHYNARTLP